MQVEVGDYRLELPSFWVEGTARSKPGLAAYNGIVTRGVSFDFHVITGKARDPDERARFVAALAHNHNPKRHLQSSTTFSGTAFEVHRFEDSAALGGGAVYQMEFCDAYDDLLHFAFAFTPPLEGEDSLRNLFHSIVFGAIVERGPRLYARK